MTTQRKLTRPGPTDTEHMVVTCTPDKTAVEFFEFQGEALEAARENIHPTTSTYLGKVTHQGQHAIRGSSKHIAILVEVDDELRLALRRHGCASGRDKIATFLRGLLGADLDVIRSEYRSIQDDDKTQPGRVETRNTYASGRSTRVCETESCNSPVYGDTSDYCAPCRSIRSGHGL